MGESKKIKVKPKPRPVVIIKKTTSQLTKTPLEKSNVDATPIIKETMPSVTMEKQEQPVKTETPPSLLQKDTKQNAVLSTKPITPEPSVKPGVSEPSASNTPKMNVSEVKPPKPKSAARKKTETLVPTNSEQLKSKPEKTEAKPSKPKSAARKKTESENKPSTDVKAKSSKPTTKKNVKGIPAVTKNELIYFMDEIMLFYQDHMKQGTLEQLNQQNPEIKKRPELWTTEHVGEYLIQSKILKPNSEKKGQYVFDETRWGDLKVQLLFGDPNFPIPLLTPKVEPPVMNEEIKKRDEKPTPSQPSKTNSEPINQKGASKGEQTQTISPENEDSVMKDRYAPFPRYLLKRVSADAQRAMEMGILEIDKGDLSRLEWAIEHLQGARLFFDPQYPAEKEILDSLDEKTARISQRLEVLRNKEADRAIRDLVIEPLVNGKFEKILRNWGEKYGVDDCAYEIIHKIGFRVKRIPLSEMALRKRIVEILKERFPEKAKI